jgi:NAD(P)-dependent dehydrogenase (short-subunit alcohol dehydrogenase family)
MAARTLLITGGSGTFGTRLMQHFLEQGDRVIFTATSTQSLDHVCQKFMPFADNVIGFVHDFLDEQAIPDLLVQLEQQQLAPEGLINNARSLKTLAIEANGRVSRANFINEYLIDVVAPYELTMGLAHSVNSQLRSVVNIGSQYGIVAANPKLYDNYLQQSPIHYGVAKAALGHLTKELAVRLADKHIQVNCIAFGGVEGRVNDDFKQRYAELSPIKRMLSVDDIVGPVDFILSDKSAGMTGQTMQVDGGWSLW